MIKFINFLNIIKIFKKSLNILLLLQEYANTNENKYIERFNKTIKNIEDLLKSYGYNDLLMELSQFLSS
ncbi:protein of unknown function [Methanocaldococcus lauensis]|nr:protein of unknown function [Methanocaldococcus lauensis]